MKKYLMTLFLMLFVIFICGCQPEKENLTIVINGESVLVVSSESQYSVDLSLLGSSYSQSSIKWSSENDEVLLHLGDGKFLAKKPIDKVIVYAELIDDPKVKAEFEIQIIENVDDEIDLGGYTITIWYDPKCYNSCDGFSYIFGKDYVDTRDNLVNEIEEKYNCNIEIKGIPVTILDIRPSHEEIIKYIIDKVKNGSARADFIMVPAMYANYFIEEDVVISLKNYKKEVNANYYSSGSDLIDEYSIKELKNIVPYYLIYNKAMLNELGMEKTPEELFKEGKWTYSEFVSYLKQAQAKLEEKYGELGKAGSEKQEYYAISESPTVLWHGLNSVTGEQYFDKDKNLVNFDSEKIIKISETVKEICDPTLSLHIDFKNSWFSRKSLFAAKPRWTYQEIAYRELMNPDFLDYSLIPWPMKDGTSLDEYKIGLSNESSQLLMFKNETDIYQEYGCTQREIYEVINELYSTLDSNYNNVVEFTDQEINTLIYEKINNGDVYLCADMFLQQYGNLYFDYSSVEYDEFGFCKSIYNYVYGDITWEEAVKDVVDKIQQQLNSK